MLPLLVEPQALASELTSENILIVDLCRDENYIQHHLPGAVHVSPAELICGVKPAVGKLPSPEDLEDLLSRIGYTPDKHIIAYDDEGGGWAGRFIWTLDVIGHQGSSVLNGGLIAWAMAQLPLTTEVPWVAPTDVTVTIHTQVIAEKEDVLKSLKDDTTMIWDARSPEEYAGTRVAAARGGHIPGAVNLDWLELMDRDNGLKLRTDVEDLVRDRGFDKAETIITHCQTHHRSGLTYFVGKLLALNIKAYHGSWSEWGNDPDTPIDDPSSI